MNLEFLSIVLPLAYLILIPFYYAIYFIYLRPQSAEKSFRRRFLAGLTKNLEIHNTNAQRLLNAQVIFAELLDSVRGTYFSKRYTLQKEIDRILACAQSSIDGSFEKEYGQKSDQINISALSRLSAQFREQSPYADLSPEIAGDFSEIHKKLKGSARHTLESLAKKVLSQETDLYRQERRSRLSFLVSAIGVILTLFFGVLSFAQFLG